MRWCRLLIVVGVVSAGVSAWGQTALEVKAAKAQTFYIDDQAGSNQVSFTSESTLEDFTGVCNKVRGSCEIDPKKLEAFKGRFSLRVADMKTGIDLRDEHMRSADWLDAAKNPEIVIAIDSVEDVKKSSANTATMTLVGSCTIKGKTQPVKVPATLTYLDETPETQRRTKGDLIRIRSEFPLKLSDYDVKGPQGTDIIGLKVNDTIKLKVTIFGSTTKPPEELGGDKAASQPAVKPAPPKKPS